MQNDNELITIANLQSRIAAGWDELHAYLGGLSAEQRTRPTDAAGWTVKDHAVHLAFWEATLVPLLEGRSRAEAIGVDEATWTSGIEPINALLQKRHHDMAWEDVLQLLNSTHEALLEKIATLSDEDLQRPYNHYQPDSDRTQPVIGWLVGDTYEHYAQHIPWMAAIVAGD